MATQGSEEEIVVGRRSELTLNSIYLKNRIAELGIKQWWLAELTLSNEADQLASIEDQKSAAQLLASSSLIEKLGPIGEWDVIDWILSTTR